MIEDEVVYVSSDDDDIIDDTIVDYDWEDELDGLDDFDIDTAKCSLCGRWYCTCCGCDCWMDDFDDEDEEL